MILASAITCLALNVYFESRNQPEIGQLAVAAVTLNRAGGDKEKICQVVTQPYQFSWTINRLKKVGESYYLPNHNAPKDVAAWIKAWQIAEKAIATYPSGIVKGATFYHTVWSNPKWDDKMKEVAKIGSHIFYVPINKSQVNGEEKWNHTALSQTPIATIGTASQPLAQTASIQDSGQFLTKLFGAPRQWVQQAVNAFITLATFFMFAAVSLRLFLIRRLMYMQG